MNPPSHRFVRPDGSVGEVADLRLIAYARFAGQLGDDPAAKQYLVTEAIVDTGAFSAVVGEDLWRHFRPGVVDLLPFARGTPAHHRTLTVAGGTFPFDLGEMTLDLRDRAGGQLAVRTVAKFTRDGGRLAIPLILGLRGGLFDGRRLVAEPDPAAPFGQGWAVEGP